MSHLSINKREDYYPSAVEIFHRPGEPYITIDIDLIALPRETETIRMYLKSKTGQLTDAEIASSNECVVCYLNELDYVEDTEEEFVKETYENLPVIETETLKPKKKRGRPKKSEKQQVETTETEEAPEVVAMTETEVVEMVEQIESLDDVIVEEIADTEPESCISEDCCDVVVEEYDDTEVEESFDDDVEEAEYDSEEESEEAESRPKKKKDVVKKPKEPKVKYARRTGRLVKQIGTPTCTGNVAPTLMATGYGTATYKNLYSVGHFPKLGIFEVWEDDEPAALEKPVETVHYERDMTVDVNETESGVVDAGAMVTHYETTMTVDNNEEEAAVVKRQVIYKTSDVNSGDRIREVFSNVKNAFGSDPLF